MRRRSTGWPTEQALGCFVLNVSQMQFGSFRAAGFFIESGG